jgi:hypothetical protein
MAKRKRIKDKERSTKHSHTTKMSPGSELFYWRCFCILITNNWFEMSKPRLSTFQQHLHMDYIFLSFTFSFGHCVFRYTDSDYPFGIFKLFLSQFKKSLKIPKGQSETVYRRRTDNTMANRKSTNNDRQNIAYTTKYRVTRTSLKTISTTEA